MLQTEVDLAREHRLIDVCPRHYRSSSGAFKDVVDWARESGIRLSPAGEEPVNNVRPLELFDHWGCGPTALAMLYLTLNGGWHTSEREIGSRIKFTHGLDTPWSGGTEHWMMIEDIECRQGLAAVFGTHGNVEELKHWTGVERLPVIVEIMSYSPSTRIDECHYVLVNGVLTDGHGYVDGVRYADPDDGRFHVIDADNFRRKWVGFGPRGETIPRFYLTAMDKGWLSIGGAI